MLVTVSICTWNRSNLLDQTLRRMTEMTVPDGIEWELILVDNNSTDDTPGVVGRFDGLLPIRYIVEPKAGLSNARNTAVRHANGTYVVWTDDDVLVDPGWLQSYVSGFKRYPDASIFGGPILPWFEGDGPDWLHLVFRDVDVAYAARDCGEIDSPMTESNIPFGANMGFRLSVLRERKFDPELGRVAGSMRGGEETAMVRDLLSHGYEGRWLGGAKVQHFIPRVRQTTRYLWDWYAGYGSMLVRLDTKTAGMSARARPRWIWRELFVSGSMFLWRRAWSGPSVWIGDLKRAAIASGQFREFGTQMDRAINASDRPLD